MNPRRLLYPAIALICMLALGWFASRSQRAAMPIIPAQSGIPSSPTGMNAPPAAVVELSSVSNATLLDDINAVGNIRSNESVVLKPEIAGRISRLNFADGQPVKKGQVLVAFDDSVNRAEVQQAFAELAIAKSNFNRNADLAKLKFISERVKEESEANVQVLDAKLALAKAKLSKLEILAPFSGIVGIRNVSVGDYVKDGAELVNLEDLSSVKVDFRIPEKFAEQAQKGQSIEVNVDALPGRTFNAHVDAIDPQVDSAGRSALLRGRIANPDGKLKPGMFARVRLIIARRDNALVVPEEAIVPMGDKSTVWRVLDGKATRVQVKLGLRRATQVEILQGLALGDKVVTAGQMRLERDGTEVRTAQGTQVLGAAAANSAAASATATAN
jgi:membrane fusion protein (multidrug efflux system)